MNLIKVRNLRKYFRLHEGYVHAVDNVNFVINEGETVGIVGESGCGKSTVGRTILNLISPTQGEVLFRDQNIAGLDSHQMRPFRKEMGIVFQDPYSSLNPRMNVLQVISEPLRIHLKLERPAIQARVYELLEQVGLKNEHLKRYPHQFSGGQRQRIAIARALALGPKFIVFDEPTSALDVSVQAQVLNLITSLQKQRRLTYLFISHNLNVVEHIADRIFIMYLGKIVEAGPAGAVFSDPKHPYTKALISAIPALDPIQKKKRTLLQGDVPSPVNPPQGCRFHTRCPIVQERCHHELPEMRLVNKQEVACHLA